jgi:predicted membrane channel-forming protein YqfA (hemolysin III family)
MTTLHHPTGPRTKPILRGVSHEIAAFASVPASSVLIGAIVFSVTWETAPKPLMALLYVVLGWTIVPALPVLRAAIGAGDLRLLLVGGLLYTSGAVVYAIRNPDPFPGVFGYP